MSEGFEGDKEEDSGQESIIKLIADSEKEIVERRQKIEELKGQKERLKERLRVEIEEVRAHIQNQSNAVYALEGEISAPKEYLEYYLNFVEQLRAKVHIDRARGMIKELFDPNESSTWRGVTSEMQREIKEYVLKETGLTKEEARQLYRAQKPRKTYSDIDGRYMGTRGGYQDSVPLFEEE